VTFPVAPRAVAKRRLTVRAQTIPGSNVKFVVRDRRGRLVGLAEATASDWGKAKRRVHLNLRWRGQRNLRVIAVVTADKRYRGELLVHLASRDRRVLRLGRAAY
jgi:hypothetical protein